MDGGMDGGAVRRRGVEEPVGVERMEEPDEERDGGRERHHVGED